MSNESPIAGMTVNERLHHFGLLAEFDAAIRAGDRPVVIDILRRARFTEEQASYTASRVLSAPETYGYPR